MELNSHDKVFIRVFDVEKGRCFTHYHPRDKVFTYFSSDDVFEEFKESEGKSFLPSEHMKPKKQTMQTIYCSQRTEDFLKDSFDEYVENYPYFGSELKKYFPDKVPIFGENYTEYQLMHFMMFVETEIDKCERRSREVILNENSRVL